jgi:acylphosphatase
VKRNRAAVRLRILGAVGAAGFPEWICHRARILDLNGCVMRRGPGEIEVLVSGDDTLIDAMEVACSLGPADVMVERIEREGAELSAPGPGFHPVG